MIANLLALPAFKIAFGDVTLADGSKEISAPWQSGLTNGAYVGEVLGLMLSGIIADRIGYRKTMIVALVLVTGFIFIVFFTNSLTQLLVGLILMGIPWGVFQTLTTTYAAEVCPTQLRAYLTTYVNLLVISISLKAIVGLLTIFQLLGDRSIPRIRCSEGRRQQN